MANNPYVNKVIYGENTLIDLTNDTVTPETLKRGTTAHMATGEMIRGQMEGLPAGGTDGDVLAKNGSTDYSAKWTNTPPQMGSLAYINTDSTADKTYQPGEYLVYSGQLYKVGSTAIAQGETLNPEQGGNIVATTVDNAIASTIPAFAYGIRDSTNTSSGTVTYTIIGNLALLQVSILKITSTAEETVLASGLPPAYAPTAFAVVDNTSAIRVGIFTNGELKVWWGNTSISTTAEYSGLVLYRIQ